MRNLVHCFISFFASIDDPCASNPCQNNGTCFTMPDISVSFVCLCTDGFTGDTCGTGTLTIQ